MTLTWTRGIVIHATKGGEQKRFAMPVKASLDDDDNLGPLLRLARAKAEALANTMPGWTFEVSILLESTDEQPTAAAVEDHARRD